MKFLAIIALSVFSLSTFAESNVTCELKSLKNKSVSATIPLTSAGLSGIESDGNGLDIGRDNYNFSMGLEGKAGEYIVDIYFYENNNVIDEVGGLRCKFKYKTTDFVICRETIESETGKLLANFECRFNKI